MILIVVAVVLHEGGGIRVRFLDSIPRRRRRCNAVDRSQVRVRDRYRVEPVVAELVLHGGRRARYYTNPKGPFTPESHSHLCGPTAYPLNQLSQRSAHTPKKFKPVQRLDLSPVANGQACAPPSMHHSVCHLGTPIAACSASQHMHISAHARLSMCIPACASLGVHVSVMPHATWNPPPAESTTGKSTCVILPTERKHPLSSSTAN
jgi:hypothetical protein